LPASSAAISKAGGGGGGDHEGRGGGRKCLSLLPLGRSKRKKEKELIPSALGSKIYYRLLVANILLAATQDWKEAARRKRRRT
jgi:hypothetical protein